MGALTGFIANTRTSLIGDAYARPQRSAGCRRMNAKTTPDQPSYLAARQRLITAYDQACRELGNPG